MQNMHIGNTFYQFLYSGDNVCLSMAATLQKRYLKVYNIYIFTFSLIWS